MIEMTTLALYTMVLILMASLVYRLKYETDPGRWNYEEMRRELVRQRLELLARPVIGG